MDEASAPARGRPVAMLMTSIHPSVLGVLTARPWPDVAGALSVHVGSSVSEAARQILRTGATYLLLVDDRGRPVGMVLRSWLAPRIRPKPARSRTATLPTLRSPDAHAR